MPCVRWSAGLAFGICGLIGVLAVAIRAPWWIALGSAIGFPVLTALLTAGITARRRK